MSALTPETLLRAYAVGLFPMAERRDDETLYWIDPEKRGILPLDKFRLPRRLARFHQTGGPDVLRWEKVEVGDPGAGQVRIRHTAVGLNYIDVYHRTGLYPVPSLPSGIGMEAAGVVEAVGDGVAAFAVGQRVAYASGPIGSYAEARLMAADRLVALPDGISDQQAAAMMLQGMTAQYLLRRTYRVREEMHEKLKAIAGQEGVGLNDLVRYVFQTFIEGYEAGEIDLPVEEYVVTRSRLSD